MQKLAPIIIIISLLFNYGRPWPWHTRGRLVGESCLQGKEGCWDSLRRAPLHSIALPASLYPKHPACTWHIGPPRGGRLLAELLPRAACAGVGRRRSALQGGRRRVHRGSACRHRATTLQRKHTAGVRHALRAVRTQWWWTTGCCPPRGAHVIACCQHFTCCKCAAGEEIWALYYALRALANTMAIHTQGCRTGLRAAPEGFPGKHGPAQRQASP